MKTIGIIGVSEGNGHPFSFSAIINGFDPDGLRESGWPGIYEYVRRRHPSEFGLPGFAVTHAWTQDAAVTDRLCAACRIPNRVENPRDLLGTVDAVIIARDDHEEHHALAMPFLEAGFPVFVDKPLSLDAGELTAFRPFLESGQLMSCSGMRYARELDEPRARILDYAPLKLIRGAVVLSWEKYGVHLLEAILALPVARPISVQMLPSGHASAAIELADGALLQIDALGEAPPTFRVDLFGKKGTGSFEIRDNFSMFRRTLWEFATSILSGRPAIPAERTLEILRVLIAGRISMKENRKVSLDELVL